MEPIIAAGEMVCPGKDGIVSDVDGSYTGRPVYGGMPVQLGWCNGHNTKLNCLEYHRCSEFNLGTEDFVLILGDQREIENGSFDTARRRRV